MGNNLAQMFTIIGPCAIHQRQIPTYNVKVTLGCQSLTWPDLGYIFCVVYIFLINQEILKKKLAQMCTMISKHVMCNTHTPLPQRLRSHLEFNKNKNKDQQGKGNVRTAPDILKKTWADIKVKGMGHLM
jgi:hypothetical protein